MPNHQLPPVAMAALETSAFPWSAWETGHRRAAVVLLFAANAQHGWDIILTKRTTTVGSHKGQIGLAGGRADAHDRTPEETALRELHEELGIPQRLVQCCGRLPAIPAIDGSPVIPIVACTQVLPTAFVPSAAEVERVIPVPWQQLTVARRHTFRFNIFGMWRESSLYEWQDIRIWGLTAHILDSAQLG